MKQFICKEGASNFYLVNGSIGSFLCPPNHAMHKVGIQEDRGGHNVGVHSLEGAIDSTGIPNKVKIKAKYLLKKYPGAITEDWIIQVYKYFHHCYSKDGIDRNVSNCIVYGKFWGNLDQETKENPKHHLGYLFVKQYDSTHEPRLDLIWGA